MSEKPQYACVGCVYLNGRLGATGVLIAPRWVLTAAHVARKGKLEEHEWEFHGQRYRCLKCIIHPCYEASEDAEVLCNGWDIALVKLAEPVTAVTPASRYRGSEELNRMATVIGYGQRGSGLKGVDLPLVQEKLGGQNVIDGIGGTFGVLQLSERVLLTDFDHPSDPTVSQLGDKSPAELEIGTANGDSGGALFIEEQGKCVLAGVLTSRVPSSGLVNDRDGANDRYGQVQAFVRVSRFSKWIKDVTKPPQ